MTFTDETRLRTHLGGIEAANVSSEQALAAIEAAHGEVLRDLKEEYLASTDVMLQLAETELAVAIVLRMLAGRHAVERPEMEGSTIRPDRGEKFKALLALAEAEERRGRNRLQCYVSEPTEGFGFSVTKSGRNREGLK